MSQADVGVDFTLETVQYKFATIIGELCGKPSVLSQFAVWLDLRLAEYKLKGSISLDCSGLKPDPDWLQGLKDSKPLKPPLTHTTGSPRHGLVRNRAARDQTPITSQGKDDRTSPEIVVIKEEPQDSVFPVHIHENSSNVDRFERKRAAEMDTSNVSDQYFLPSKSRRFSTASMSSPHTSQDSLSESTFLSPNEQSTSNITEVVESDLEQIIKDADSIYQKEDNPSEFMYQRGDNSADFYSAGGSLEDSMSSEGRAYQAGKDQHQGAGLDPGYESSWERSRKSEGFLGEPMQRTTHGGSNFHVYGSGGTSMSLARKTQRNIAGAVASFWRWASEGRLSRDREMYDIPAEELDSCLAEFYMTVKKPNGDEYNTRSLMSLRTHLSRYLKDNHYPDCIVSSPKFVTSQQALKKKCLQVP